MPVEFFRGDIFATDSGISLAHGCNCAGAMGKGIAVEFKRRWPEMYAAYKTMCSAKEFAPGDVFAWKVPDAERFVFNLGTQRSWRSRATIDAVEAATQGMLVEAVKLDVTTIALPLIGAGLGGLPSSEVKQVLTELSSDHCVQLIVCDRYEQGKSPV